MDFPGDGELRLSPQQHLWGMAKSEKETAVVHPEKLDPRPRGFQS